MYYLCFYYVLFTKNFTFSKLLKNLYFDTKMNTKYVVTTLVLMITSARIQTKYIFSVIGKWKNMLKNNQKYSKCLKK